MDELKNDSIFVLRTILLLASLFMVCFSKLGIFLMVQVGTIIVSLIIIHKTGEPFWTLFIASTAITSIIFEMTYSLISEDNKESYTKMKKAFIEARIELKSRRRSAKK